MGLDIFFYKAGVDIQKNKDDISDAYRRLQVIKDEIEQLEGDYESTELFSGGITHNLNEMAKAVGLYDVLWHPEKIGITVASQMILPLEEGLEELELNPDKYKAYNPPNGWGSYKDFVSFCKMVLQKCRQYPEAIIEAAG